MVGAWYVAAWVIGGNDFFIKHVLKENLFRVIDPEALDTGHEHGPFYMLPNFLVGALPWSLLAPAVAWWLWRMRPLDATTRYLVVWFLGVIIFYSIPASKRSVYILPAYPAGAHRCSGWLAGPGPRARGRAHRRLGVLVQRGCWRSRDSSPCWSRSACRLERLTAPLLDAKDQQGAQAALLALRAHRCGVRRGGRDPGRRRGHDPVRTGAHWLRASVAFTVSLLALYAGVIGPVERGIASSRTFKPFLAEVRQRIGSADLGFVCAFDYGAVFYAERHVPLLLDEDGCRTRRSALRPRRRRARRTCCLGGGRGARRSAAADPVRSTGTGTRGGTGWCFGSRPAGEAGRNRSHFRRHPMDVGRASTLIDAGARIVAAGVT